MPVPSTGRARLAVSVVVLLASLSGTVGDTKESFLKNPLQAPSAVGDSGTALNDDHPIARLQARKNAIQRSSQRR
ncbi:hypothetical protein, partial [Xanthomonas fragariae]|uniref:hypothetical protein n=1 Tax=Xanthomonas fragariae TaxID=48664 RepID=UPI0035308DC3